MDFREEIGENGSYLIGIQEAGARRERKGVREFRHRTRSKAFFHHALSQP